MKLSFLMVIPFLALVLTALLLLGSSDEISLADLLAQTHHGSRPAADLNELWHVLRLTVDSLLAVVLNWKVMLFFFVSLFAMAMTGLFLWQAMQIYRTAGVTPASVEDSSSKPVEQEGPSIALRLSLQWKARMGGLVGKLGGALSALLVLLGLLILAAVHYHLSRAIQSQAGQRALATAMNMSDAAATHFAAKNRLAVHALVGKYSIPEEVAYIFLTDGKGTVLAHNLRSFPVELKRLDGTTAPHQRSAVFRGNRVLETSVPMGDGALGVAYYGIWQAAIDRQVRQDIAPILGIILLVILAGIALSIFLARRITQPILVLKEGADRMSRGEFDKPVGVKPFEDFGELASSLERLRSSLNAAFMRLDRE